jgi:tRNA pseudouridine38-40 synthase
LGNNYYGFATQKDKPTIEGTLRNIFRSKIGGERIHITYASRTDKGVHAIGQTITINLKDMNVDELNAKLPEDIAIWAYCKAPKHFDARRCTIYRHYKYIVFKKDLDLEKMKNASKDLLGIHNFKRFCYKVKGPVIRRIYYIKMEKIEEGYLAMEFIGSKFARGLIRNLVDLLTRIGSGEISNLSSIWEYNGPLCMAPPENLYLIDAYYPLKYTISDTGVEKVIKALKTMNNLKDFDEIVILRKQMLNDFWKVMNDVRELGLKLHSTLH